MEIEMAISESRQKILNRIEEYERSGWFDRDVNDDPPTRPLRPGEVDYTCKKLSTRIAKSIANKIGQNHFEKMLKNGDVILKEIKGQENLAAISNTGALITCNHFSVFDNYAVYKAVSPILGKRDLYKIIREGNYTSFPGLYGYLFRHCNTLPLSSNISCMKEFLSALHLLWERGEKVLIYHTLGRVVEEGKLPLDCGVIVMNCTTLACIAKYILTGMPLVEKCITVDGSAIQSPKNVIAPIGSKAMDLIDFCGGFSEVPRKILLGGPMMGVALADLSMPVLKQTNALLVFNEKDATPPKVTPCIKCGRCTQSCPLGLSPDQISKAYKAGDAAQLEKLKVNLCMECGCCSYVCPAKRNIVQRNKMAKTMLRQHQMKSKGGQ